MFSKVPLLVWFLVPTLLVAGLGVFLISKNPAILGERTDEDKPAAVSDPVSGTQDYPIVGRNHISQGTSGSGYNSNPPSSGPHWPNPVKNGVYDSTLPDEQLIHNLEHGYVWISYKSDVGDEVKKKLAEIVVKDDWKIVLEPRDQNESAVSLVAWGRVLKLDTADYDRVEAFIKTYRNRAPEKTPD